MKITSTRPFTTLAAFLPRIGAVLQGMLYIGITFLSSPQLTAQQASAGNAPEEQFSLHAQETIIYQNKPAFNAPYSGTNSISPEADAQSTITSTLFLGTRLWQNASLFLNPELGGGSGLSGATGIAAQTNGESYRVGDPKPQIELARLYFRQIFALDTTTQFQTSDANQIAGTVPVSYFSITVGKISIADYFDDNKYSHDPRTQFIDWALMDNGAWDYPANTRGYTPSIVLEYITKLHELRYALSLVAKEANGSDMNWNIADAWSQTLEYTYRYQCSGREGAARLLGFLTRANMGNYDESIEQNPAAPDIIADRRNGRTKYGFGASVDQELTDAVGAFARAGWNDGKNETWMFTEIDRSLSGGISVSGRGWNREHDCFDLAYAVSGLSDSHRRYLEAGGSGFILGDGKLNYAPEHVIEANYSLSLTNNITVSGIYQLVVNPGYNSDRHGPVHVFSVRMHVGV